MSEATPLSLLLATQLDICLAGLLPKGDTLLSGRCSCRPVATLLWCKPRQSKRPSSIHFVQSRNCDNLLSSLFIHNSIRVRSYLLRAALVSPFLLSWRKLYDKGDSSSFLHVTGLTREAFDSLLYVVIPPGHTMRR